MGFLSRKKKLLGFWLLGSKTLKPTLLQTMVIYYFVDLIILETFSSGHTAKNVVQKTICYRTMEPFGMDLL